MKKYLYLCLILLLGLLTTTNLYTSSFWGSGSGSVSTNTFEGAIVYNDANQDAGFTITNIIFPSEIIDTSNYHDNDTNNHRLTVPVTGVYRAACNFQWPASLHTTAHNWMMIGKNGSISPTNIVCSDFNKGTSNTTGNADASCSGLVSLTAGEYITCTVYHETVVAIQGSVVRTTFSIELEGE